LLRQSFINLVYLINQPIYLNTRLLIHHHKSAEIR
jgi:hypothetical protein